MRLYYRLTTQEPLVLSQSTATTNNHLGLDYIPGSAILGAIASRIYNQLSAEQSFALFHSGLCRFGPAYPLVVNEITLPVPACWHGLKHEEGVISNHAALGFVRESEKQYKQYREGYISHDLQRPTVKQGLTTRTALSDNLTIKDGQLYTYTTLEAGQEFGGWIEADSHELLNLIKPFLNSELTIGRSRTSEFGSVKLECSLEQTVALNVKNLDKMLVLWCLSDVQCFNALGSPTFTPEISEIHAQLKGRLNTAKSFIRTRKVRRFNRARGGLDSEQQLIAAGSVLVYDLEEASSDEVLTELANRGIGANRQQGLGWIAINPEWARQSEPQGQLFEPLVLAEPQFKVVEHNPSQLLDWIEQQVNSNFVAQRIEQDLQRLHQEVAAAYHSARAYNNTPRQYQAGPSSSQWRRLDDLVKNTQNWQNPAFNQETGVCKIKNDDLGWGLSWQQDGKLVSFSGFVEERLKCLNNIQMRRFIEQLCRFDPSTYDGLKAYTIGFKKSKKQGEMA
ncbi:MAG: hypothetical protein Q4G44_07385 [Alcaligenaceae bacterium]|nr:hypothetical protein [Alcaligenaceae bacterium]